MSCGLPTPTRGWTHRVGALAIVASLGLVSCSGIGREKDEIDRGGCSASGNQAVELRYRVESGPTAPGSFRQTMSALCARLVRLGLRDVEVGQAGHALVVAAPRRLEADVRTAAMPGKLNLYDWEANVTGRSGPEIPFSGRSALFDAVEIASRMRPRAETSDIASGGPADPEGADRANDTAPGARYYLFGSDRREIAGPASSPGALATAPGEASPGARMLKVPQGIVVVEAARTRRQPESVKRYFVLEDDVELSSPDITDPRPGADRATRDRILTVGLTERGRIRFGALTRRIAERGAGVVTPPGANPADASQRFAVTLDDRLLSLVTIDFRESPEGIDGRTGIQIGGEGTLTQARLISRLLRAPPLPARLVPLTRVK